MLVDQKPLPIDPFHCSRKPKSTPNIPQMMNWSEHLFSTEDKINQQPPLAQQADIRSWITKKGIDYFEKMLKGHEWWINEEVEKQTTMKMTKTECWKVRRQGRRLSRWRFICGCWWKEDTENTEEVQYIDLSYLDCDFGECCFVEGRVVSGSWAVDTRDWPLGLYCMYLFPTCIVLIGLILFSKHYIIS